MNVWIVIVSPFVRLAKINHLHLPGKLADQVVIPPHEVAWDLDCGEKAVRSRVLHETDAVCLRDDRAARDCAQLFGAQVKGTVGVLLLAKKAGLVPVVRSAIEAFLLAGARLHDSLIRDARHLVDEN